MLNIDVLYRISGGVVSDFAALASPPPPSRLQDTSLEPLALPLELVTCVSDVHSMGD